MFIYIVLKIGVGVCLVRAYRRGSPGMKPIAFGLGALLVGLSVAEFSVGLFGPSLMFSYILLGACVSTTEWVEEYSRRAVVKRSMGRVSQDPAGDVHGAASQPGLMPTSHTRIAGVVQPDIG
jgi:hypothetical protein